jgi:hypothetical protein
MRSAILRLHEARELADCELSGGTRIAELKVDALAE